MKINNAMILALILFLSLLKVARAEEGGIDPGNIVRVLPFSTQIFSTQLASRGTVLGASVAPNSNTTTYLVGIQAHFFDASEKCVQNASQRNIEPLVKTGYPAQPLHIEINSLKSVCLSQSEMDSSESLNPETPVSSDQSAYITLKLNSENSTSFWQKGWLKRRFTIGMKHKGYIELKVTFDVYLDIETMKVYVIRR